MQKEGIEKSAGENVELSEGLQELENLANKMGEPELEAEEELEAKGKSGSEYDARFEGLGLPEWAEKMMKSTQIDGDTYKKNEEPYMDKPYWVDAKLTLDDLIDENLQPETLVEVGDRQIGLSRAFLMPKQRYAILGYVETDEGYKLRTYYRSLSSGMWRYLPAHVGAGEFGNEKQWYDKGYDEQSLSLPPALQDACNEAVNQIDSPARAELENPDLIFRGTCYHYDTKGERDEALKDGSIRGDYFTEVSKNPYRFPFGNEFLSRMLYDPDGDKNFWALPNFEEEEVGEEIKMSLRGAEQGEEAQYFTPHRVLSNNGSARFTFMESRTGEVFLANLEMAKPEVTSTGVAKQWIQSRKLITPLYEYRSQAEGAEDPGRVVQVDVIYGDEVRTPYVKMSNFLDQTPLIREYRKAQAKKRGEELGDLAEDVILEMGDKDDRALWQDYLEDKFLNDI